MKFRIAIIAASIAAAVSVASIASAASTYKVGSANGGVWKTTEPAGNTYYVGTANGGVWKTLDGGSSWDAALGGPDTLQALPGDPDGIGLLLPAVQAPREASRMEQTRQITVIQDMNH